MPVDNPLIIQLDAELPSPAVTTVTYARQRDDGNRVTYVGSGIDILGGEKDFLIMSYTPPKQSADSFGIARCTFKFVRSITVDVPNGSTAKRNIVGTVDLAIPTRSTNANPEDEVEVLRRAVAGFLLDDNAMEALILQQAP